MVVNIVTCCLKAGILKASLSAFPQKPTFVGVSEVTAGNRLFPRQPDWRHMERTLKGGDLSPVRRESTSGE
jgi:hypothetical protein